MIYLDALIVNVALPAIQSDFKVGESGLQWVVTAYSLGMTIAVMSAGTVADIYGRRKLYFAGIALFTAASAACGMASSLEALNLARAVQGIAAATGQRDLARARQRRVSRSEVEELGDRHLDRDREHGHRDRADARRLHGAVDRLALDLHGQRSRRARRPGLDVALRGGVAGRAPAHVRYPRAAPVHDRSRGFRLCRDRRPAGGLALGGDPYAVRGRGGGAGGIHRLRTQKRGPDDGPEALRRPHVFARDHHDLRRDVRRIRDVARDHAVHAERARSLADGCRVAPLAVQHEPDDHVAEAGKLVGVVGSRRLILLGLASQIVGFAVLIAGLQGSTVVVSVGLVFVGLGAALCLTPITSLAMTAVPPERAGMASGIMSAQRALGSTVGFAVLGSILAAALTATLSAHLAGALPDPTERKEVAATIIGNANPRAYSGEIGPGRPIRHLDAATQKAILAAADSDFVEGIRFSLATAMVFLALVLAAGFVWFPRGKDSIADAEREARALASEETVRQSLLRRE